MKKKKEIKKNCLICGRIFFVPNNLKNNKYCSKKCRDIGKKTNLSKSLKNRKITWGDKITKSRLKSYKEGKWKFPVKKNIPIHNKESKKKISESLKEQHKKGLRKKVGKKISETYKKKEITRILWKNPEYRKKQSEIRKKNWENPIYREKQTNAILKGNFVRPTKPEQIIIQLIKKHNLPFNYVGNGKLWINGYCPDFINKEKKLIIEVFGSYWHNLPNVIEKDKRKLETYSKYGYKTLIIWEHYLINDCRWGNMISEKEIISLIEGGENYLPHP